MVNGIVFTESINLGKIGGGEKSELVKFQAVCYKRPLT